MYCPHCGKEISEGQSFCSQCGLRIPNGIDIQAAVIPETRTKTTWENREQIGLFHGLVKTLKEVLFTPADFFRNMPVNGGLTDPLLYGLIVGMAGLIFISMQSLLTPDLRAAAGRFAFQGGGLAFTAAAMPFFLMAWLFIIAGALHLVLMLARGAKAGFEATFRVVSYCVSPLVFTAIPFCGMLITVLWVITLAVIGLREAHETTGGKAAFAVLFPFLFCCGMLLGLLLFMGVVAASFGSILQMYR